MLCPRVAFAMLWAVLCGCGRVEESGAGTSGGASGGVGGASGGVGGAAQSSMGGSGTGGAGNEVDGSGAGSGGEPEACEVTPAEGAWAGAFWQDPYLLELERGPTGLSGTISIGGADGLEASPTGLSAPIEVLETRGGAVHFVASLGDAAFGYTLELDLTLAPDREHMAGRFSLAGSTSIPAVFVRLPNSEVPPPIACSAAVSGACFDAPLVADYAWGDLTSEADNGDLVVVWENERAFQHRIAFAHYDFDAGVWTGPTFIDPGTDAVHLVGSASNAAGAIAVAWTPKSNPTELWVQRYSPATRVWSAPELVGKDAGQSVHDMFVDADGNVLVAWRAGSLLTTRYDSESGVWQEPQVVAETGPPSATFAQDAMGNGVAVWFEAAETAALDYELWVTFATSDGAWGEPRQIYSSKGQIRAPSVNLDAQGRVVAAWESYNSWVMASSTRMGSESWTEPVVISGEATAHLPEVSFTEAGAAIVTFNVSLINERRVTELDFDTNTWSAPRLALRSDLSSSPYQVQLNPDGISVVTEEAGVPPIASLPFGTCEGY